MRSPQIARAAVRGADQIPLLDRTTAATLARRRVVALPAPRDGARQCSATARRCEWRAVTMLCAVVALVLPGHAAARTTLHVALAAPPRIVHIDVDRGVITGSTPLSCRPTSLVTVGSGAFLVWSDVCGVVPNMYTRLNVLHVASGEMTVIPGVGGQLLAHPGALRLFANGAGSSFITVGGGGIVSQDLPCRFDGLRALSGDGQSRAHACVNGPIMNLKFEVIVESSWGCCSSGRVEAVADGVALNVNGSTLFSARSSDSGTTADIIKFDVQSGRETMRTSYTVAAPGNASSFIDPRTSRLFVLRAGELFAFEPDSLALSGTTAIGGEPGTMVFDPATTTAYVSSLDQGWGRLSVIDTTAMAVTFSAAIPEPIISMAIVSPPAPPDNLTRYVAGSQVRIAWALAVTGPAATAYVVEAGTGPGLSDLARVETTDTWLTAAGVRPGTYYVRVRARNAAGSSPPSAEIAVVVP